MQDCVLVWVNTSDPNAMIDQTLHYFKVSMFSSDVDRMVTKVIRSIHRSSIFVYQQDNYVQVTVHTRCVQQTANLLTFQELFKGMHR